MSDFKIIIERQSEQDVETKGDLNVDTGIQSIFHCLTLELPWKDNQKQISCIPIGSYDWVKVAPTHNIPYTHISILNVPGRSGVCIHSANIAAGSHPQLQGCIAVGSAYADINSDKIDDIVNSRNTFGKLMDVLGDHGKLIIL